MSNNVKIAELLCTKFCHDIIGPIGAVNNGIDFLMEEIANLQSQAADLISNSSRESIARLQYFRQAFGATGSDSSVSLSETKQLAETYFSHSKSKLVWKDQFTDQGGHLMTSTERKLILNMMLIASYSMIKGGDLVFEITKEGKVVSGRADIIKLDTQTAEILSGSFDESKLDARNIQAYYTRQLAVNAGRQLIMEHSPKELSLKLFD